MRVQKNIPQSLGVLKGKQMEQREIDFFCLIYIYIYILTSQCLSKAILRNTEYVLKINTSVRAKDQQQRKKQKNCVSFASI